MTNLILGTNAIVLDSVKNYFRGGESFWDYFLTIFDIAIVAVLIYLVLIFIRGTKASKIVLGFIILGIVFLVGRVLQLETLSWVLRSLGLLILVSIPVVFQPELRRALERLGRTKFLSKEIFLSHREVVKMVNAIVDAARVMSDNRVGGIIVIKKETGLDDYIEASEVIDARVTSKLLLNIFFPNSPLHDGAVIIKDGRVAAASCTLPLSEDESVLQYGTRHRAALGITESTDAVAVVVSEESGAISIVQGGKMEQGVEKDELGRYLIDLLEGKKA